MASNRLFEALRKQPEQSTHMTSLLIPLDLHAKF
jgi:hypothetical protein